MKRPKVTCSACCGTGIVPLRAEMFRTYAMVLQLKETCAVNLHLILSGEDGCKVSAVNNRLVHLEKLGLLKRRKLSKNYYWSKA